MYPEPKLCKIVSCVRRLEWVSEIVHRTECLLSERIPVGTAIQEVNRKGWFDLCFHVGNVLQALLDYYDLKHEIPGTQLAKERAPLAMLAEFDQRDNPLYELLGQPDQGYTMRFGDRLKPQPRNAIRDQMDSMRIYLDWCYRVDLGNGLASESNGVPVSLPSHSDLVLWPDQLLTIFYKAMDICYQDHNMKWGEASKTHCSIPGSSLVDSSLLHSLDEDRANYNSFTSRVDGTVLLEPPNSVEKVPVWIRLPKTTSEEDQGSRVPSVFDVPRRTEQAQPLHNAQRAALSQVEWLKFTCISQRDNIRHLRQDVKRLTMQVEWKEEEVKWNELARRQLAQEHDSLKEEYAMLKTDNRHLELPWREELKRRDKEREIMRKALIIKLDKNIEELQISQNRNEILNSHVDRLEAQLKETEAAWSEAAQECEVLKVEVERLRKNIESPNRLCDGWD